MKKFTLVALLAMVFVLALSACSGGGGGKTTINTNMTDFKFDPAEWTVPAGQEVTLNIKNEGAVEHDWVLMAKPVTPPASDDNPDVIFMADVEAGSNVSVTFTAPAAPGEYQVVCAVPGHLESGMAGKLIVTEK